MPLLCLLVGYVMQTDGRTDGGTITPLMGGEFPWSAGTAESQQARMGGETRE